MNRAASHGTLDHEFTIRTPEGVAFSLPLAGPLSRCLAWMLDVVCLSLFSKMIGLLVTLLGIFSQDLTRAFSIILFFAINIGYAIVFEWYWHGQTPGKRVVGLRVMDIRGFRLRFGQIVIRNLLRTVDSLPVFYLIGGVVCLVSRNAQRLGDLAGNTIVVRTKQVAEPRLDQILGQNRYNSLRTHSHLVARLRQQTGPKEADIALQALARRDELEPAARVDLFRTIATHFRRRVVFPEEAIRTIPDEQYVQDVVDLLFRR